ncbi:hypothetical protein EMIHUDRAFT_246910 [Emiliania huxleyi CCMP1516]|uniref:Uncharacterized protein n=2 Tax=Emiliania huxleyi TaxID=2903 RepID=A0A0D3IQ30_EMIH1|nr:hypothetical protein EMIHUDRAFT_246910 [Emiliania huxleyi CCMP1516]EOD13365.1 hypothetical protein EMIHUDRAFT_246910 [Emiliania huxleyi CCMP1516]|eukprot:XP_005765794.1 hypothetical protein EMIHUDRAFT_246910 [Emiliania huxleyi CCMP1516]
MSESDRASFAAYDVELCDRGGVHKLQAAFAMAELARKAKLEKMQAAWCAREADIDARLKDANDVLARTLPADREAAQMSVDVIKEERRNFYTAQRKEKVQLEGKVRKKFKAALAVTAARDPIAERAKATAKAAIASVLAAYKDKAAV